MVQQKKDFYAGLLTLAFGLFLFISSFSIGKVTLAGVGPDYLPKTIGIYIIALSILLVTFSGYELAKNGKKEKEGSRESGAEIRVVISSIILLIAYVFLLEPIGFVLMSAIFLFCEMYLLAPNNHRKLRLFLLLSVVLPVIVYYIFVHVFSLMLPAGILDWGLL